MKYSLDSCCGPPKIFRKPLLKTGIEKHVPETIEEEYQRVFRIDKEK